MATPTTIHAQRGSHAASPVHIIIQGEVLSQHPGIAVAGLRYLSPNFTGMEDTATTDAKGHFTLQFNTKAGTDISKGFLVDVRTLTQDSTAFDVSDRIEIKGGGTVQARIERYPRVTLADGALLQGAFSVPKLTAGNGDMGSFISNHLEYPEAAQEAYIQGTVVVRFTVDEGGAILQPEIVRSVAGSLDAEVLRVLKEVRCKTPGQIAGKPAKMICYMPVGFRLE